MSSIQEFDTSIEWYLTLQSENLKECGFSLYRAPQKPSSSDVGTVVIIGESIKIEGGHPILLGVHPRRPNELAIALNSFRDHICFCMPPTKHSLEITYKFFLKPALAIPPIPTHTQIATIQRDTDILSLKAPDKKEIIVFLSLGEWADMTQLEKGIASGKFTSRFPLAQATADGRDGAASQYFSAFSASLCSLIRTRALDKTLFYMHVEYLPCPENIMHSVKRDNPGNVFFKMLPADLPADVAGLMLSCGSTPATIAELIEEVHNDNFNSLLVLCVLAQIGGRFDDIFLLLASHPNPRFRDVIAIEAYYKRSTRVFDEVKKHGVSPEVLDSLESARR
ncbi:MAG: hypothetical protein JXR76_09230 [Deltaproteobacteria bacterium]|nr:hypothetical protein [Deltaproteobacteria bacterium]